MIPSEIKTMKSVTTFKDAYNIKQLEPAWRFKKAYRLYREKQVPVA